MQILLVRMMCYSVMTQANSKKNSECFVPATDGRTVKREPLNSRPSVTGETIPKTNEIEVKCSHLS